MKEISHDAIGSTVVADFLQYLFDEELLLPSTIKGYRSAITAVLRSKFGYDASTDPILRAQMCHFNLERPRQRQTMPKWDLGIVLSSFLCDPFVSVSPRSNATMTDHVIPLKWRTVKTCFLLALATGRRVSCLFNLMAEITLARGNVSQQQVVVANTLPSFRAKNQHSSEAPVSLTIPGIAHLCPKEPERFLCPVRALRMYLQHASGLRSAGHRLFRHWEEGKIIRESHISQWVLLAIKNAYTRLGSDLPDHITAHEVRALAASWAYRNDIPLDAIKEAVFWRSDGVFQEHYLRDMSDSEEGIRRLGPIVAAGSVVYPSR